MLEVKIGPDTVMDADWVPYRPEDYEGKAVRYLDKNTRRREHRERDLDRLVIRGLMTAGGLLAFVSAIALLLG